MNLVQKKKPAAAAAPEVDGKAEPEINDEDIEELLKFANDLPETADTLLEKEELEKLKQKVDKKFDAQDVFKEQIPEQKEEPIAAAPLGDALELKEVKEFKQEEIEPPREYYDIHDIESKSMKRGGCWTGRTRPFCSRSSSGESDHFKSSQIPRLLAQ